MDNLYCKNPKEWNVVGIKICVDPFMPDNKGFIEHDGKIIAMLTMEGGEIETRYLTKPVSIRYDFDVPMQLKCSEYWSNRGQAQPTEGKDE